MVILMVIEHSAGVALWNSYFASTFCAWDHVTVLVRVFCFKVSCTLYFFVKACGRGELSLCAEY
jgi:hypothetical protein